MPYFIRKIDKAKWVKTNPGTADIAADAITNCLLTKNNQLSFWRINDLDEESLNNAVKAIISSFTSGLDTFDIIIFRDDEVPNTIDMMKSPTPAPFLIMQDNHYDFIGLTLSKLTSLSAIIYAKIMAEKSKRITRSIGKTLIKDAIASDPEFKDRLHISITKNLEM